MGHSPPPPRIMAATGSGDMGVNTTAAELPVEHVLIAHRQRLCSQLDNMRKNNVMCDVTVVCDTTEFTAHRVILSAASAYFHGALTDDHADRLSVPEVQPEVMELILSFVYTGHVVLASVGDERLQSLLAAAHTFRVTHLYHWCRERMVAGLSLDNLDHVWDVADLYSDPWLQSQVALYAAKNFRRLVPHPLFLQLPAERVVALVGNERLHVGSHFHDEVLAAVLSWVRHDAERRQRVLPDIIPQLKFDRLSARYVNSLDGDPTVMASLELLQALTRTMARRYQRGDQLKSDLLRDENEGSDSVTYTVTTTTTAAAPDASLDRNSDDQFYARSANSTVGYSPPRQSLTVPVSNHAHNGRTNYGRQEGHAAATDVGRNGRRTGGGGRETDRSGTELTVRIRGGRSEEEEKVVRHNPRIAVSGHEPVLLVLGQDKEDYVVLQQFQLRTRKWSAPYRLPVQKKFSSVVAYRGLAYLVGGKLNLQPSATAHACDVRQRRADQLRDMRSARAGLGLAVLDGLVYAVGGYNRNGWVRDAECYDPGTDTWQRVAALPEGKEGVGLAAANGRLYAVGGVPVPTTDVYDPATDQWTRLSRMRHARVYHGIGVLDGVVYVIGGFGHCPERVQCLDCDSGSWDVLTSRSPQQCRDTWCAAVPFRGHLLVVNSEGLLWDFDVGSECWTKLPSSFCLVGGYISGFVSAALLEDDGEDER